MYYNPIEIIPSIIKSSRPSIYEGESFTTLEYVSKISVKVNECITEYNNFIDSVIKEVSQYKENEFYNRDLFERTMEQKFYDFRKVIELKYKSQDLTIANAINKLTAELPTHFENVINKMYENGELDVSILNAVNGLTSKFDNLNKSFTTYQNNVNDTINSFAGDIETFKNNSNDNFNSFKEEVNTELEQMKNSASIADMSKSVYDKNNNGVVDNAEALGGNPASYYAKQSDVEKLNTDVNNINTTVKSTSSLANNAYNTANTAKSNADNALSKATSMEKEFATTKSQATKALNDSANALNLVNNAISNSVNEYTHNDGKLIGSGNIGIFKSISTETIGSIMVNDNIYIVNSGGNSSIDIVKDSWYMFILDGSTINFNSGGVSIDKSLSIFTNEPTSPKENDIYVETDISYNYFCFSSTPPILRKDGSELQNGDLWFKTDTNSAFSISIGNKCEIEVYPTTCKQMNNGVWETKIVKLYKNDKWNSLSVIFISNGEMKGNLSSTPYYFKESSFRLSPTITQKDGYLEIYSKASSSGTRAGTVFVPDKIDFSCYNTIAITFSATSGANNANMLLNLICCDEIIDNYSLLDSVTIYSSTKSQEETTYYLDISSINTFGYIGIAVQSCQTTDLTMKVKEFKVY